MEIWEDEEGNKITFTPGTITLTNGHYWDHIGVTAEKAHPYKKDGARVSVDVNKSNGEKLEFIFTGVNEDVLKIQGVIHSHFHRI